MPLARVAVALFILIVLASSALPVYMEEPSEQLREYTRRSIPGGLPWYYVAVFGDNRPPSTSSVRYSGAFYILLRDLYATQPFAVIGTGDHVGRGYRDQIAYLWKLMRGLDNVWLAPGNHDLGRDTWYWRQVIAPLYYYEDAVPGWRIVVLNSEDDTKSLVSRAEEYLNATNRSLIVVIHRPLYPDVDHNIYPSKRSSLEKVFEEHNVSLVLQGHWHGYAEEIRHGVRYVIVGGGGAPLYSYPGKPGYPRNYHYMQLLLYPNGTYTYRIIKVAEQNGREAGWLRVEWNGSRVLVYNGRSDFWGRPTRVALRVNLSIGGRLVYVVLDADPGVVEVTGSVVDGCLVVSTNTTGAWYAYTGDAVAYRVNSSTAVFNCTSLPASGESSAGAPGEGVAPGGNATSSGGGVNETGVVNGSRGSPGPSGSEASSAPAVLLYSVAAVAAVGAVVLVFLYRRGP